MNTEIRIDTARLNSHREYLRRESRIAFELAGRLELAQSMAPFEEHRQFHQLIQEANRIAESCRNLENALDDICYIFDRASNQISDYLKDSGSKNGD